ncbi:hypothetical protein C2845_PM17G00970 [Panicum miliaceum]|uniref:Major facilitator superfamily (MFS) profile domain-containing protein n=1 Tax=Panicum miliaceum TaxID=4540 RepID=A0A3L6PYZ5_PANMI|nr:hypothetical protein C2845_PM17G00970 [Panicum miliaceum]
MGKGCLGFLSRAHLRLVLAGSKAETRENGRRRSPDGLEDEGLVAACQLFCYWMAIATRFLLGALNGLLGPIKAYAIEVCRPEHEALALSLVSTAWGIGLIIGPALGGYLALPAENFPNVFSPDSFFGSLSSEDVGQVLAVTGASLLVYQLFLYPRINKVLGPINSSRIAAILCIPILFAYPYMTYLSEPGLSIILNIASVIKNNLSVTIITGTFILQNNAVECHFFKAVAPAGAGIV